MFFLTAGYHTVFWSINAERYHHNVFLLWHISNIFLWKKDKRGIGIKKFQNSNKMLQTLFWHIFPYLSMSRFWWNEEKMLENWRIWLTFFFIFLNKQWSRFPRCFRFFLLTFVAFVGTSCCTPPCFGNKLFVYVNILLGKCHVSSFI